MEDLVTSAVQIERKATAAAKKKTGRIILATGRGGTGKSTFVALASRYLSSPLLLLDIDPDQSLADMLGIDLEETRIKTEIDREIPIKTVSDLTSDLVDDEAFQELGGGPPFVKIPLLLQWYTQYSSKKFDLVSLGPRWAAGDYRAANYLLEFVIPSIGGNYANIVVDSPAGLEHLNRKVIPKVDDLFLILDPSLKSIKHVARVKKIAQEAGISYQHLYLVGNYEFDGEAEERLEDTGETYLGKMGYDAGVKEYNLRGKSLLELPANAPACLSIKKILAKAGYQID